MWTAGVTSAQDRRVTLHLYQSPLKVLFKEIETQCGYTFVYSDEVVSDTMRVSLKVKEVPVSKILDSVLASKQLFHQVLAPNMMVIGSLKLLQKEGGTSLKTVLTGRVLNPEGIAVPFATIALLEDEVQVNGAIANEQGSFQFLHQLKAHKNYALKVSSVGYEVLNLKFSPSGATTQAHAFGQLRLLPKAKQLNEVSVMGNQKIIEMEGSNIIFNVDRSINAQGSNALELLGKAPGVTVGNDNNISLNGKAGAAILIDGKQTYLSNREIAELLKSMSSSAIKSIEIINSPSAKYDAAGTAGIINVRTLKTTIQGFNAGFTTGFSYGVFLRNNQDLSFSYRKNRLNLYGNYNHFIGYYSYLYGGDRIQEGKFYNSFTDDVDKRKKMGSRLGADFAIDRNQTIGVLLNGNFIFGGGITDTQTDIGVQNGQIDQTLTAINDYYHQKTQRYNVNLNYKYEDTLGRIFNIDADYGDYTKGAGNMQSNKYTNANQSVISDNLYRSVNANSISLKAIKVDYTTNLWKGKLETGAKYSSVAANNEAKFLEILPNGEFLDSSRSNRFAYREEISSAYVNYKRELGKWQLQGGLRVENSASTGKLAASSPIAGNGKTTARNYTNLFPFLSATVKPSALHQFSLSYSRRIDRPDYQSLNPFIYLLDELSYWQGNPFLEPQLSHRLLGQYVYKSSTIVGLSYTRTNNFSVEVTDTVEQRKIVMVPRNLGHQQHLALTLTQMLNPYKWWSLTFNGTFYHLQNDIDFGEGRKQQLKQTAARLSLQQTFKLPFKLSAEILGIYNSRRLVGANKVTRPNSQVDLGLQRSLMDNKASLRLVFSDIYKGNKTISIQDGAGLYIKSYGYFESQQVKLNFSYRFSTGNNKGPRNRSSALENENGRIK